MSDRERLDILRNKGQIMQEEAFAFFDSLDPVDCRDIRGVWKGTELASGHPLDGVLTAAGWYGKRFVNLETVYPLLFEKDGQLRQQMLEEPVHICIERARYITEYMKSCDADKEMEEHPVLFRARAVANYLDHKKAVIPDNSLLAGTTGSCLKSAPVYPEFIGLMIWSELDTISRRKKNPQLLTKADTGRSRHPHGCFSERAVRSTASGVIIRNPGTQRRSFCGTGKSASGAADACVPAGKTPCGSTGII